MSATKQAFAAEYRRRLPVEYEWAKDAAKLDRFMASMWRTITTTANSWNYESSVARAVWRCLVGKGRYTLKGLRGLADDGTGAPS